MKLTAAVVKTMKENLRDWKVLVMVLVFSPFFVLLMYLFYGGGPTVYKLGLVNQDNGIMASQAIVAWSKLQGPDGAKAFELIEVQTLEELKNKVKNKTIDLGVQIPKGYSDILTTAKNNHKNIAKMEFYGSMSNVRYTVAAIFASDFVYKQGMELIKVKLPTGINETFFEKKLPTSEFDSFVPGLISLAVLMILFTACASIVKENDKRTLVRLKLSRLGAFHFLTGIGIVQAIIASFAIVLSYFAAIGLGYEPAGGFAPMLFVGILSSFSMVAVSLVVSCYLETVFDVLTIGCFPFFIMMFFSGSMFPLPRMEVLSIAGHGFGVTDLLPLTHTANAFNKILNYGTDLSGVMFDLLMIVVLTILYFSIGLALYHKRRLSKA